MTTITSLSQLDLNQEYSYADYLKWQLQEKVELIKGKILAMSPAPTRFHQDIAVKMTIKWGNFLYKSPCKVYTAPFDVRLPVASKGKADTVVQPDLCVVCDLSKLDEAGCNGSPDLIIEILSKGNSKREMDTKFDLYQEAGVREYWIIDPLRRMVLLYSLVDEKLVTGKPFLEGDTVTSKIFPDFSVAVDDIFAQ